MTTPRHAVRDDHWLSEMLAMPAFRVEIAPVGAAVEIDAIVVEHAKSQARAFYYAKVGTDRTDVVRRLSRVGFFLGDTNVSFALDAKRAVFADSPAVAVGEFDPKDGGAVLEIARTAFQLDRFHRDPFIAKPVADAIKVSWCLNYTRKTRGDRLFVATLAGEPAGFLAALTADSDGARRAIIDLIAVSPAFQRRRVGAALVASFVEHYRSRAAILEVGTQLDNTPSIHLYQQQGFALARSQYVLHMHMNDGAPRS